MSLLTLLLAVLGSSITAIAAPLPKNEKAAFSDMCGQWSFSVGGPYTLYNNLWNQAAGSGGQCSQMDTQTDGSVTWTSSWNWINNDNEVKSFSNVQTTIVPTALNAIQSLSTTWNWAYTADTLKANIAYDTFTAPSATAASAFEIMVWIGTINGAQPLSYTGAPIASTYINGQTWDLWKGPRDSMVVFSFVARETDYTFSGDLMDFYWNLIHNHGLPEEQVLVSVGAGTESFYGSNAVFTTSEYVLQQVLY